MNTLGHILYSIGVYGIAGLCIATILCAIHQICVLVYRKIKNMKDGE